MILVIDNYDSFTYNLVQYLGELGQDIKVYRNDKIDLDTIRKLNPSKIVISPGPKTPKEAAISNDILREISPNIPTLGVCLGHQCIGYVYGGVVKRADRLMHGKTCLIYHNEQTIFQNIENPFEATRYHSLIVERETLPPVLEIIAWTDQNEIMGLRHKQYPIWGVQFHPESVLTKVGKPILNNFVKL
ncbi:MAG: aminodeoxychorismate/anthranilate synthase component II [bacterium]|nr:aminodeoxychorismate/anthranilate synthase component II [bacterium]